MWLWIFSRTLTLVRQCLQVTLEEGCTKKNWSNVKPYIQPQRTQYIRTVTGHWPNVVFRWPIAIPSSLLCSLKPVCFLGATNHTENDFCRALYCEMRYINVRYLQYNTICQPKECHQYEAFTTSFSPPRHSWAGQATRTSAPLISKKPTKTERSKS